MEGIFGEVEGGMLGERGLRKKVRGGRLREAHHGRKIGEGVKKP